MRVMHMVMEMPCSLVLKFQNALFQILKDFISLWTELINRPAKEFWIRVKKNNPSQYQQECYGFVLARRARTWKENGGMRRPMLLFSYSILLVKSLATKRLRLIKAWRTCCKCRLRLSLSTAERENEQQMKNELEPFPLYRPNFCCHYLCPLSSLFRFLCHPERLNKIN